MLVDILPYSSPQLGELRVNMPVTKTSPWQKVALFRLQVPNVKMGDIIDFRAYGQVSNDISPPSAQNNTMFAYAVMAGATPATETIELAEGRATNINAQRHHEPYQVAGIWVANADYTSLSVAVWAWAASSSWKAGWRLTIDKDYGRLSVLHIRKG